MDMVVVTAPKVSGKGRVVRLLTRNEAAGKVDAFPVVRKRSYKGVRTKAVSHYRNRVDVRLLTLVRALRALDIEPRTVRAATGVSNTSLRNYVSKRRHQDIPPPSEEDIRFAAQFIAEFVIGGRA